MTKFQFPPLGNDATLAQCEDRLEELREYGREHPESYAYLESQREEVRAKLRAIRRSRLPPGSCPAQKAGMNWPLWGMLIVFGLLWLVR